jgi:hypothetical protein
VGLSRPNGFVECPGVMSAKIRRRYSVSAEVGFGGLGDLARMVEKRAMLDREGDRLRELGVGS